MQFGLWFEPEMVNPDSNLYRDHPDWILSAEGRVPLQHRNQLVLDLTNPEVWTYLRDRMDAILGKYPIDYVKWDHNRDLLEAGSGQYGGAPAAHAQGQAYYALLDDLRSRHPHVHWESCAAGGGRIDLGVIERVQRFWTSDMTDALARQQIQRWTVQYVAPEYLGAHVSAPTSHQTGRAFPLDFRAATAFFLAFGIEWDLTTASEDDLERLAAWCELHKRFRPLLHTGRTIRIAARRPGPARARGGGRGPRQRDRLPRPARRLHPQPRLRGPGTGPRSAGGVPAVLARSGRSHGAVHERGTCAGRPHRRSAGRRAANWTGSDSGCPGGRHTPPRSCTCERVDGSNTKPARGW